VNLSFGVVWLGLAAFIGKEYLKLAKKRSVERNEEAGT
jgi:hypothetical protein